MKSSREQWLLILAGLAVVVYLGYQFVLGPLLQNRASLLERQATLQAKLDHAHQLIRSSQTAGRTLEQWRLMGMNQDASGSESQLLHAMRGWSQDSRLSLLSIRPDRASSNLGLEELSFQTSGDGGMRAVSMFLHRLEMANLPVRVRELHLATRTEATDDLSMQLRISSLWEPKKNPARTDATVATNTQGANP